MTDRQQILGGILFGVLLGGPGLWAARAAETNHQFAFQVTSTGTENKIVIPRATTVIELVPLSGPTSKAPMNRGDYMLCRQFDWRDQEQILHTGLKCGSDTYAIAKFGFEEEK